ncbi:MAG TPA: glycosyltransferase family 4 protein [Thermotogota bacterium]|nr:glycosyltransferase family 4 protein [Thermotogota bacterium]
MRIILTSMDNPKNKYYGGKHIHLYQLEKGLSEIEGNLVETCYYDFFKRTFFDKVLSRVNRRFRGYTYSYLKDTEYKKAFISNLSVHMEGDVLNAHDSLSMISFKGNVQKRILTLHGYLGRESLNYGAFPEKDKQKVLDYFQAIESKSLSLADQVITVDNRIKEYVMNDYGYPEDRINVVFNAIDIEKFQPVSDEIQKDLKQQYGFAIDECVVLIPRRLVKKNGILVVAEVSKRLKNEKIKFLFIGDGPLENQLRQQAASDKSLKPLGRLPHDKIVDYYKLSDIILIPSIPSDGVEEATSLSMLEGMSCAKPVVVSAIGGLKEVIKDGINGFLTEPANVHQIAEILQKIYKNPESFDEIRKKAREHVVANHSYLEHARIFDRIYKKAL